MSARLRKLDAQLGGERGGVLVIVAVWLPTLVVFVMLVLEVGNWFEHKRHLQTQADAAAFAGGGMFARCFDGTSGGDTAIFNEASKYAGAAGSFSGSAFGSPSFNGQVGGTNQGTVSVLYQSKTYTAGGPAADDTETDGPCETAHLMFDVKATEAGLPLFFANFIPGLSSVAAINAHARVNLRAAQIAAKTLPLAVPDVNPSKVIATFVNEATGGELSGCSGAALASGTTCSFLLTKTGLSSGLTTWAADAGVSLPAAPATVGVRVGLGTQAGSCAGSSGGANFVCYDYNTASRGLASLRVYAPGGSAAQPSPPVLGAVWPTSGCSGSPFFSDASLAAGQSTCAVGVQARVDFGTGSKDPTNAKNSGGVKAKLNATINGQTVPLAPVPGSYDAASGGWLWSTSGFPASIAATPVGTASSFPIALDWEEQDGTQGGGKNPPNCTTKANNPCTGSFGSVQRFTSATDDDDGPVKLLQLAEPGSADAPYSLRAGSHTLTVTVGLKPSLSVQNPPQLIALRLAGGSRTSGVNCDGTGNSDFTGAFTTGCNTAYQINANRVCPDPAPPPGPADCVPLKTGNLGSTITTALDTRFAGCPPNNWPTTGPNVAPSDPRIVQLLVTDYAALSGSGSGQVPVTSFAAFYIAGWSGNHCGDAWPFSFAEPNGGNIWGYYVKQVIGRDTGGTQVCDPNSVNPCVPVLTR